MSFGVPAPQFSQANLMDKYANEHLDASSPIHDALDHALSNSTKNGLSPISVTPAHGKFLKLLCQLQGAKKILEIGTLGGYSTIWFADVGEDVHVTSIEIKPKNREVAMENIEYAGYSKRTNVILGAALDVLPELAKEIEEGRREKFDFVFIDADWGEQWDYFDWAIKMMKNRGCIYVDNVVRQILEGGVVEEVAGEGFEAKQGMKELVEKAGKDSRVDGVVMQTVGEKDHDGFLLAIVK